MSFNRPFGVYALAPLTAAQVGALQAAQSRDIPDAVARLFQEEVYAAQGLPGPGPAAQGPAAQLPEAEALRQQRIKAFFNGRFTDAFPGSYNSHRSGMDILQLLSDFRSVLPEEERKATLDMWTRMEPERTTAKPGTPFYYNLVRNVAAGLGNLESCKDVHVVTGCSFPHWFTVLFDRQEEEGVPRDGSFQLGQSSEGDHSFSSLSALTGGSRFTAPYEPGHSSDAASRLSLSHDGTFPIDPMLRHTSSAFGTVHPDNTVSSAPMSVHTVGRTSGASTYGGQSDAFEGSSIGPYP